MGDVVKQLDACGIRGVPDPVGYDYPEYGFGLYAPDERLEGVTIYARGYYDRDEPL